MPLPIAKVYAVEVSGACNLESKCDFCPMHNRPRSRKRGLMNDDIVSQSIRFIEKTEKIDVLALHVFGEPLLHPKFDTIAELFSKVTAITMSTNGVLLDEKWADRLAKVNWSWISVSPWDLPAKERATALLVERDIKVQHPPGVTHNWAGQSEAGPKETLFNGCPFLVDRKGVIRWNGDIASCCITDREGDEIGTIYQEPSEVLMRGYSLCATCHHAI